MLAGQKPFVGDDITEVLASVVKVDVDWDALPSEVPATVQRWLRRCLKAEPKKRCHAIADIRLDIEDYLDHPEADSPTLLPSTPTVFWKQPSGWVTVVAVALVASLAVWFLKPAPEPEPPRRLEVSIGADASLDTAIGTAAVLSPDGSLLAFVAQSEGSPRQLYVRRLDQLQATPLSGTEGVSDPFFSPEGQWIGFFTGGKLKKISVTGGAAASLCDAPVSRGGDWGDDGSIVFAASPVNA